MFRIGIIGAGWIAEKMAQALAPIKDIEVYAIASRSIQKAESFAKEYNIPKAYGSYAEMVTDPQVDLVYIATPHSHHFEHSMLALESGKPVLVEKAFTANASQAEKLIQTAKDKGLFITEAIWTRYMPLSHKVKEIMESGIIGEPRIITATLCYMMENKERIVRADLCGGALLDLGVYALNFARMYFGTDIVRTVSNCHLGPTGMDMHESISLSFADGKYMEEFLDITPGSLSILGLMNDKENRIQLLIDEEVLQSEFVGCHPCINTSSLRMRIADLKEKLIPALGHEPIIVQLPKYEE